ncbi:dockerin type I repeat-containing protein [Tichowtungia aerotolerans]|uniref:Dockerin domain-containing protein n=1 Tax=Tichowtungia aerotolerans TaxID=2697043 RepID=A0A6P1M1M7_9BACT|nr:dockerin type I repeat-containing protein [Tichowtungia aerotolerans]QHI68490.1 hypothetical protein GT409_03145 [Tichowtungia aerotolerans]
MRRLLFATTVLLALVAGSALAVTQVTNIFTEGFNSGFSDPYTTDGQSWGSRFGITAPGINTNTIAGTEGDAMALLNNDRAVDGATTIIGAMDVELGTVPAEGVTYTFSGNFSWQFGTAASAAELFLHSGQSGFVVDMGAASTTDADFFFDMPETNWATHSFSYTTTAADVGKAIRVRIRLADEDNVDNLTQLLADNWVVTRETPIRTEPLVIDVRINGLIYYYNPANEAAGYVCNDGVITDGGETIGLCAYETMAYTFGLVTNGASVGEYRVNAIDFSGVDQTATGNGIGTTATRNILTNSTTATLVDFVYDGTDFWFLADDGKVFQNSSTNAVFDLGTNVVATYDSLTLSETKLLAGATAADGTSKVLEVDGGMVTVLVDQAGAVDGTTWVAGQSDSATWYHCRAQGYTYEGISTWVGGAPSSGIPLRGLAASTEGVYGVHKSGYLYLNGWDWAANMVQQTIMANAVDLAVVQVSYVVPAFPAIADPVGSNLIPNGEFDQVTTNGPAPHASLQYNIDGTFGDYSAFWGDTAEVTGWTPAYDDPNGLTALVGTPHADDGGVPALDGTFYLDTLIDTDDGLITLNSIMDYSNGLVQSNALNGVTIDSGKTYRFSVDAIATGGALDLDSGTFTASLTDGSNTPITGGSMTGILTGWDGVQVLDISGADLLAAGQVNVVFDQVNTNDIPGYPDSIAPTDVSNATLVSQIKVYSVTLAELLTAGAGDVNKDGVVNQDDVDLANSYLDGSVDGGDDAATRIADLIAQGMTSAEALEYLNLTGFDLDGDGTFNADDVAAIDSLLPAPELLMVMTGSDTMAFEWEGSDSKEYTIESCTSLILTNWAVYNDGVTTYSAIAGSATGTNTLTGVLTDGSARFFRLIEGTSPISYLSVADGSFELDGSGWSACMASWNDTGTAVYELYGGSGHMTAAIDGTWCGLMSNLGTIHQDLDAVNAGDTLTVVFYGGRALESKNTNAGGVINCTLKVGGSSNTVQADTTLLAYDTWQAYTNTWVATESGTLTLEFSNASGKPWIDHISNVKRVEP